MGVRFQIKHDTIANWTALNPIFRDGELVKDETGQFKLGDGTTHWLSLPYYGIGATGATGPAGPAGQVIINFGGGRGSNFAQVNVSDTNILSTSIPAAEIAAVPTSDHDIGDHLFAALNVSLACGAPMAGVGFIIYASSLELINGTYTLNYRWS